MAKPEMLEWTVKIRVSSTWVADGFDLTEERMRRIMERALSSARSSEISVDIVATPDPEKIAHAMGYGSDAERQRATR